MSNDNKGDLTRSDSQEQLSEDITRLLEDMKEGDPDALSKVLTSLHRQLRQLAGQRMSRERAAHTWQPTELVNELYLRIQRDVNVDFKNEGHFLSIASRIMCQILIDHARKRRASKRGGGIPPEELRDPVDPTFEASQRLWEINEALQELRSFAPREEEVVFQRFYGGMTIHEIAELLEIHESTVKRDIKNARLFLRRFLSDEIADAVGNPEITDVKD